MGGFGSTRWGGHTKKACTYELICFSLAKIRATHGRDASKWQGATGVSGWRHGLEMRYAIWLIEDCLELFLTYAIGGRGQVISVALTSTKCNYGGVRYWMHCPHCKRRCTALYFEHSWACRVCHDLTYFSVQEAHYYDSLKRYMGADFAFFKAGRDVKPLLKKWGYRQRLTKGERQKIADYLGCPLFMIRNRWYQPATREKKRAEVRAIVEHVMAGLLKKSDKLDTP
jgi:hypothetical protein